MPKVNFVGKEGSFFVLNRVDGRIQAKDLPNLVQAIELSITLGLTDRSQVYVDKPSLRPSPDALTTLEYMYFCKLFYDK
ncbi:MAG: hypothetical protein AABX10_01040 [Nanoarchaeota archaeon]